MSSNELVEGECDFSYPGVGKPLKTWYRVRGELRSGARPLVALHGGPGAAHNYIQSVADLSTRYGIPVVLYDQVGCGKSTHLPDKKGDTSFWTADLFLDELRNLLQHLGIQDDYDLYGQSWGGMLAAEYAIRQPKGLHKVIIANSPSDMRTFVEEANRLRLELPQEVQDALNKHEKDGTTDSEAYEAAVMEFYARHLCRIDPMPQDMLDTLENIKRDPTVYHTMNGPSEFHITGSLKGWSTTGRLHTISVPTLVINGRYDEATSTSVEPFFREIDKVKWYEFAESSHTPHLEERERFMEVVSKFLKS